MKWTPINRLFAAIVAASLAFTPVSAFAQAEKAGAKPLHTLKVAYLAILAFGPLYRAIEKGYLADEGLAVNLEIVVSSSDTVAFLGRGQLDVAFGNIGDSLFNAISRGVDVRIAGGGAYNPEDKTLITTAPLMARKQLVDSGEVKTVKDLKGRKVAFNTRGGLIEYLYMSALREHDMTVADLDVVTLSFPDMLPALANSAIDAVIMAEPLSTISRQKGLTAVLSPNPAPGAMATGILFGQTMLSGANAKYAEPFLRAIRRAAAELQTPEQIMSAENLEIWVKYTKLPAKVIASTVPYTFYKDAEVDVGSLMNQQQYLADTKQLTGAVIPPEKLLAGKLAIVKK